MKKKLIIAVAMIAILATASFAQGIGFGLSGALHMDSQASSSNFWDDFGQYAWGGVFVELYLQEIGIGLSVNAHQWHDGPPIDADFVNYDFDLYAQYHFLGYDAFLDPFGEVGFGVMGYDWADDSRDPDPDAPIAASVYGYLGIGCGINLGGIGIFGKVQYNVASDKAVTDDLGNAVPAFYVYNYRVTLGAKLVL